MTISSAGRSPAARGPARRGFSLIEAMVALAMLSVGILGIAQIQVLASGQNGLARRTAMAASIARDFVETAQRWDWDDPRLASRGCGQDRTVDFPLTEALLGAEVDPKLRLDFTASANTHASREAATVNALRRNGLSYDGTAATTLAAAGSSYQLLWSVREINPTNPESNQDCRARLVTVVVRFPVANDRYKNVITAFALYNRRQITLGGIPEQI